MIECFPCGIGTLDFLSQGKCPYFSSLNCRSQFLFHSSGLVMLSCRKSAVKGLIHLHSHTQDIGIRGEYRRNSLDELTLDGQLQYSPDPLKDLRLEVALLRDQSRQDAVVINEKAVLTHPATKWVVLVVVLHLLPIYLLLLLLFCSYPFHVLFSFLPTFFLLTSFLFSFLFSFLLLILLLVLSMYI